MTWVAVGLGVASAVGGAISSKQAANAQSSMGDRGLAMQGDQAEQNRLRLEPFSNIGTYADKALQQGTGIGTNGQYDPNAPLMKPFSLQDFNASPAYNFNLAEGTKAIDKAANARGNFYAPQTLQDVGKYSQGVASNEFNNAYNMYNQNQSNQFNRLSSMSGQGIHAAGALAGENTNLANNMAAGQQGIGNAQASGIMGFNNSIQGGLGQAYNQYLMNQILQRNNQSLYSSGGGAPQQYGYSGDTGLAQYEGGYQR